MGSASEPCASNLLNPKSTGFDKLSRTTTVSSFKSHIHPHTHIHIHRNKVIAISAPPYCVVHVNNNNIIININAFIKRTLSELLAEFEAQLCKIVHNTKAPFCNDVTDDI